MSRKKVFLSVNSYLPGYRGGGPIQSVKNLVEALSDDFEFFIFTSNHDLGTNEIYDNIYTDKWNVYDDVNIFYSSDQNKYKNIWRILSEQNFSLLFLNSFFSTDTVKILILRKLLNINTPIVIMPRGELSQGALGIKKIKKTLYIKVIKTFKILNNIFYLTTADDEFHQVKLLLNTDKILQVSNIPNAKKELTLNTKKEDLLSIVFLSRITQKKNLDYALKSLNNISKYIEFDIYGTIEEENYWRECKKIISNLPNNIRVNYRGELSNDKVISTLSRYDLFYFPTKSENYGHVISEALQASIPVLISDQTPWQDIVIQKYGWIYKLESPSSFSKQIEELIDTDTLSHNTIKRDIFNSFDVENRQLEKAREYKYILHRLCKNFVGGNNDQ
ncbi:Glycosyltransferase involved in cell wall bisynthesis [Alkalibacterium gilvum]|uniref:Glycosyltransferase involved in cell wall bisynthesis n=1 Tax=Alkalibacterium gilvum TaxID=1130080 RepID=A0A1H6TMH8_9LACT|nr:glycosyltransferase [Alkalibacterium gilvum]SEI76952.1 Glycosyltransferase involved in cell wall bisynthesis [Alkalibacterium gilvum]